MSASNIAVWNGTAWSALGSGLDDQVAALAAYNGRLIAGGFFANAGGAPAHNIAQWDGTAWSPLGEGMKGGVQALAVYGGQLIAAGVFTQAGGVDAGPQAIMAQSGPRWRGRRSVRHRCSPGGLAARWRALSSKTPSG